MNKSFVSIVLKDVVQDYHLFHISNLKPVLTVTPTLKLMKCCFFSVLCSSLNHNLSRRFCRLRVSLMPSVCDDPYTQHHLFTFSRSILTFLDEVEKAEDDAVSEISQVRPS